MKQFPNSMDQIGGDAWLFEPCVCVHSFALGLEYVLARMASMLMCKRRAWAFALPPAGCGGRTAISYAGA